MSHGRADAESLLEFMDSRRWPTSEILVIFLGQPTSAEVGDASLTSVLQARPGPKDGVSARHFGADGPIILRTETVPKAFRVLG